MNLAFWKRPAMFLAIGMVAFSTVGPAAAQSRTDVLTGGGALLGGLIGGNNGGTGGAVAGAIIGGVAGAIFANVLDEIEAQQMQEAATSSVKTGKTVTRTFKNKEGKKTKVTVKSVKTRKQADGTSCRTIAKTISKDGQTSKPESKEYCQVKVAGGRTDWPTIE